MHRLTDDDLYQNMLEIREFQKTPKAVSVERFRELPLYKEVRRRSKSDLFFLAKYVIGYKGQKNELMLERVHRRICNLFVKKDESKPFADQDSRKERLLLYPRGIFKSTLDVIDAVQWVLCFPDIRILFLTGGKGLAVEFLSEFKSHFTIQEEPSFMNIYFPEFCVADTKTEQGNVYVFESPARKHFSREPTAMASSVDSKLSGKHFDIMKVDDAVTNDTPEDADTLKRIYTNFNVITKMLMPYGYLDVVGTRYHDLDMYGELLNINIGDIVKTRDDVGGELPLWEYLENKTTGFQVLIGRAIVPKSGIIKDVIDLEEDECIVHFPELLSFGKLKYEWNKSEKASEGQYNQNPRPKSTTTFTLPLLQRQTVDYTKIPYSGPITITWDFAYAKDKKQNRDFSTASVARWSEKGEMFIIDLVRNRFLPNDLVKAVVKLAMDWRPVVIAIEDAGGSNLLAPFIIKEAEKTGMPDVISVCSRIDWFIPDRQLGAKKIRMSALHPWMINNMLFFAKHLPYLEILYNEFQLCLVSHHHDDIPDAISQQPRYAPHMVQMLAAQQAATYSAEDASFNLLFIPGADAFGRIGFVNPQTVVPVPVESGPAAESAYEEAPSILGAGLFG
jgi:phage terminase large subunit-like protein